LGDVDEGRDVVPFVHVGTLVEGHPAVLVGRERESVDLEGVREEREKGGGEEEEKGRRRGRSVGKLHTAQD
jgi:hypothetical protein